MEAARILLIGRTPATGASVANALIKHYPVLTASSGKLAIQLAQENPDSCGGVGRYFDANSR